MKAFKRIWDLAAPRVLFRFARESLFFGMAPRTSTPPNYKNSGMNSAQTTPSAEQQERAAAEFGDLLFSLINFARHAGINPEEALERTNRKFIHRFNTSKPPQPVKGIPPRPDAGADGRVLEPGQTAAGRGQARIAFF